MSKYIAFDVETAGLHHQIHGILSISYAIYEGDTNSLPLHKRTIYMNPMDYRAKISPKALEVNGIALEDIKHATPAKEAVDIILEDARTFYGGSRYKMIAYNGHFDVDFLSALVDHYYPGTYYKLFNYKVLDPYNVILYLQELGLIDTGKSQSLESVCQYFGIEHKPHNCKSDMEAVLQIHNRVCNLLYSINLPQGDNNDD